MPMIATPRIQWKHLEMVPQLDFVLPVIPCLVLFAAILITGPSLQGDLNPSKSLQVPASMRLSLNKPSAESN
jgi:hypothetical protein